MTDSYVFQAGLFGQMQDNPDTPLPRPEELFPKLEQPECQVLSLLRCAQRHPLVSLGTGIQPSPFRGTFLDSRCTAGSR